MHLEDNDFKENLPGLWEGRWSYRNRSGEVRIEIIKIDGNKVNLTGYAEGSGFSPTTDEVYGRIENSTLVLTWPVPDCKDKYTMKRDNSNNLILDGSSICGVNWNEKVQLKKIE
jgi:hypothetical protein